MAAHPESSSSLERDWWLRLGLVFQAPRLVFAALRDDSDEAAQARQEPILLVGVLAGLAGTLATSLVGRGLDFDYDLGIQRGGVDLALVMFFAALVYGLVGYFGLGALVHLGEQLADSRGSYRRSRHLLAFACAPLALSLVVWPVRLALYGSDSFRSGGSDHGTGGNVFQGIETAFIVWSAALLVVGVRAANGWSWSRAAVAGAVPLLLPALALARSYGLV